MATTSTYMASAAMDIPTLPRIKVPSQKSREQGSQADSYCFYSTSPTAAAFYDYNLSANKPSPANSTGLSGIGVGAGVAYLARLFNQ